MKKSSSKKNTIPGSRIPIAYLIDYIKEGYNMSEFITAYPWLKERTIRKALDEIKNREFTAKHAF